MDVYSERRELKGPEREPSKGFEAQEGLRTAESRSKSNWNGLRRGL